MISYSKEKCLYSTGSALSALAERRSHPPNILLTVTVLLLLVVQSAYGQAEVLPSFNTTADTNQSNQTNSDDGDTEHNSTYVKGQPFKVHLDGMEPEAGPTYGDTRVIVRGGPFSDLMLDFPKPFCKFGHDDMVVEATYVLCAEMKTHITEKENRHKDKHKYCLQCDNSPAASKAEIVALTVSMTGDFSDCENSLPFKYYTPPRIWAIYPRYGPKDGDTVVQVWGDNFLNFQDDTRCAFGSKSVVATFVNNNYMICVSPFSDVVQKPIPFTVSLNGQQNTRDSVSFWYYSWPSITQLIPDRGPDQGGTKVLLRGNNFNPFKEENIDNSNDTFCMFEGLGKIPATVINSTKAICVSPPSYVLRQAIVEITLNNQQYTDDNNLFYYFRPPYLFDVNPREGPVSGGTKVTAIGSNFRDTGNITCKFGEIVVPGKFISVSEVECISPAVEHPGYVPLSVSMEMEMYSAPVQYLYYEKPIITFIEPQCGPDYGYTQITVHGKNFIDMGHNKAICAFNKTIFTNATIMEEDIIKCDSPPYLNQFGYSQMGVYDTPFYFLEISINGGRELDGPKQKFNYYLDPKLQDIIPDSGPTTGGTKVNIKGWRYNQDGACNKTARFATMELKPMNETTNSTFYVTAPPVAQPDAVVVAVALNGQQFSKDFILHVRDPENTYEYYSPPYVSSYSPRSGPSIGGTKIKINGYGFTPRKDDKGDVDKKKNKMWVRFIDPDNGETLAEPTLVDDLTDDEAHWKTPGLPSDTKAIMQISLNGQDYQNVLPPNKTYSFIYYESPHIDVLHPSFGKVKSKDTRPMLIEGRNFKCPDAPKCEYLMVRFGEPPEHAIYMKGTWINETFVQCKIPKYTKPDVLRVELTLNEQDYTNDGKTYGYFDPYVLNAYPRLISVEGTTKVRIKGFGFVQSNRTKAKFDDPDRKLLCTSEDCVKDATFIDKNTLETPTFPQPLMNYKDNNENILWNPINLDAAVYEDFTDNNIEVYYYQDPDYQNLSISESPANVENQIFIKTDFKNNPQDRLEKYSNFTCRFKAEDGRVMYSKAHMVKYPLDSAHVGGKPNSVQCQSPTWDLKNKSSEVVKLDIAVNGQDFKGGFDFTFTLQLVIHRTVPMAGPTYGNTRTRIIGLGYRPKQNNVDLKWGIIETQVIMKEQVTDYIYQQHQFENMIEGSQELKAYIYEAASFPRVDLEMFEMNTYHSIYMTSPKVMNWTKTHGGPYYAEVGKNINVEYTQTKIINVTTFNNATNQTEIKFVNTTENKVWIYYEYDPSAVEYYYYKDCVVKEMQPRSALSTGGTMISVVGAWFKYMPEYGVVPHCKFGDKISRAVFDSTVRITCPAPPNDQEIGIEYPFEVSLNGIDWSNSGFKFYYYEAPTLIDVVPDAGPESGGTPIYIIGKNFTNMSDPNQFNCRFSPVSLPVPPKTMPAVYLNSTTIMCFSPGGWGQGDAMHLQVTFNGGDYDNNNFTFTFFSVTRAFPRSGPSDGSGGDIIVEGQGFRNDTNPLCKLNNTLYEPREVAWNYIKCPMPRAAAGDKFFGNVPFEVAPNGKDWNKFLGGFQYYEQPTVDDIFPKSGPNIGTGVINFYGDGFRDDYTLVELGCRIGDSIGKAYYVTKNQLKCVIEDMPLVAEGEYLPAQVALNTYSWTTLANTTLFLPYGIESIYPNSGPNSGITDVMVNGKGFVDENGQARCRFGSPANYAIVEAQVLSYEKLVCKAPNEFKLELPSAFPHDVPFSIAFTSDEYDPWTQTSHKFRIYEEPQIIRSEPSEVEVGTISEILVYTDEGSYFFDPMPVKPLNKELDEEGNQPLQQGGVGGIMCKFGRFGETQGVFINETVIKCVTPSVEDDPDSIYRESVKLLVTMNGQDYEEDSSQIDFVFVGTGTYLVFWPFIIGALLIGLLVVAIVVCCTAVFQKFSMDDFYNDPTKPHTFNFGGLQVPKGNSNWDNQADMIEKATGNRM